MRGIPQGVKISAYIFYGWAVLTTLVMCGLIVLSLVNNSIANNEAIVFIVIGLCVGLLFIPLYIVVGYGLLNLKGWARIAAIILAVIGLCSFPIGTALGGAVLYFLLFDQDSIDTFS